MKTISSHSLVWLVVAALLGASSAFAQKPLPGPLSASSRAQIEAVKQDAAARSPAQRKITWSLLLAAKEKAAHGLAVAGAPKLRSHVPLEADGRVRVKIKAAVTPELLGAIRTLGGDVTSSFPTFKAVYATLPLTSLETIAARPDVEFIGRPPGVGLNGKPKGSLRQTLLQEAADSTVNDPEGYVAHGADVVRSQYPTATGAGLKIGVLSDSIDNTNGDYETALLDGYVPTVTIVPGQDGDGEAEGLAMLEVVHRLAPNAQLFFATGSTGEEQMATNIESLEADGCNIIIDDISYFDESPFQDGTLSQAVNTVTGQGVLYFSAAGNYGNQDAGNSCCWEGDFVGTTADPSVLDFQAGTSNSPQTENLVDSDDDFVSVYLFWSEPAGQATSSYFLYELDSSGDTINVGDDTGDEPVQSIDGFANDDYIFVEKVSGSARFLHVDVAAQNTDIEYSTSGRVRGHNACAAGFSLAATPAASPFDSGYPMGPYPGEFSSADQVEPFSSDGPRRMFFYPDGTAITPGNFSSTGGQALAKPDFTAADGVSTSDTDIDPFFGTSCAAPHAGAIAAMLLSYNPALTPAQVSAALLGGTVQISDPGQDNRDAGTGILLAPKVIQAVSTPPSIISFSPANGPVGTVVTVTGINLGTAVAASFNGVAAAYSVVSSTAVTATVPTGATTGPITIQTAAGTAKSTANFTLTTSVSTPVISSATTAGGRVGSAFSYQITATNSPTTFGATGLPAGLSPSSSGLISGLPTVPGTFTVTLTAGNTAGGSSSAALTLTILPAPPAITSVSAAEGQVGVAFRFQIGGSNSPTGYAATGLPNGLSLDATTGLITGTPTAAGTFTVTVSATNAGGTSSATLTLNVLPAAPVISSLLTASDERGAAFSYKITASSSPAAFGASGLPAGLQVDTLTGIISGTPTVLGRFAVTISASNTGGTGEAILALSIVIPPPVITSAATVEGEVGVAFSFQLRASNSPTSFAATGLPAGLTINAGGLISGTPTTIGNSTVKISATNSTGTAIGVLTVSILLPPPVITNAVTATAQLNVPFSFQLTASGSPTGFVVTGLPGGLTFNAATRVISGTPGVAGSFTVTIVASNAGGTSQAHLVLTVDLPAIELTAPVPSVGAKSGKAGEFLLTLSSVQARNVIVSYTIKGTAINGTDYLLIKKTKKIKAGKISRPIHIIPLDEFAGTKVVKLILDKGPDYTVGTTAKVKVKIIGD